MSKKSKKPKRPGESGRIAQKDRIKTGRDRAPGLFTSGSQRPARKDRKPGLFTPGSLYLLPQWGGVCVGGSGGRGGADASFLLL
jgi:hypothetical protein